jgi:hypothetical protein
MKRYFQQVAVQMSYSFLVVLIWRTLYSFCLIAKTFQNVFVCRFPGVYFLFFSVAACPDRGSKKRRFSCRMAGRVDMVSIGGSQENESADQ